MKPMKNFAAQQLTKKQMNEVKGGALYLSCSIKDADNKMVEWVHLTKITDHTNQDLANYLKPGQTAFDCRII